MTPTEPRTQPPLEEASRTPVAIEVRNLRYRYRDNDPWVRDRLSFRIVAGETVAIVGASGCGKTTLLKILASLLTPTDGELLVDGEPLAAIGLSRWRSMIGVVMQDDQLFAGSVAENISFFSARPDARLMEECARLASLHDELAAMPMGYSTLIGDMGTVLSGGQKQRVLIARALSYRYRHAVSGLKDGFSYFGAGTSYDLGDSQIESLESGLGQNKFQAVPMPAPGEDDGGPIVFPNPYRVEAAWDRGAQVRDHYLWFARLPRRCTLRIYTLAGDRVFETRFDGSAYRGQGARGLYDPRQDLDTGPPALSGASFAWNVITSEGQALATGLYIFSVEDLENGRVSRGKFMVVKSDREGEGFLSLPLRKPR